MGFKINRVRCVSVEERAAYVGALRRLPDSVSNCLCCCRPVGRPPREASAIILAAEEIDGPPLAIYSALCLKCSTERPEIEVIETWAKGLFEQYGGTDIPDMHAPGHG